MAFQTSMANSAAGDAPGGPASGNAAPANAAPEINLPKGGGAIHGIGEKFAANAVTGTGSLQVSIPTSPSRAGFGPQLTLSYDSGAGNGPFGLGWSLSLPSITRRTDKGLPRYKEADFADIFVLSGAEDLVPLLTQTAASWAEESIPQQDGYAIKSYRPRIEGLFARIEHWMRLADGDSHWRSIAKDGVTSFYGEDLSSRIADPADQSRVFSWLLCRSQDDKGNQILYQYLAEDDANIDLSQANERNRVRTANRYLSAIKYGNTQSLLAAASNGPPAIPWLFEVVFDYGQGYFNAAAPDANGQVFASAGLAPAGSWPARPDAFSHYRACFEIRGYRLCRQVLMFHHFPDALGTQDCLVRGTQFTYQQNAIATVLTSVVQSGYARQPDGSYLCAALPPLQFEYSTAQVEKQVRETAPGSLADLPGSVDGTHFRWLDLKGEGLQCVLAEQDDGWFYKRNLSPLSLRADSKPTHTPARFEDQTEIFLLPGLAQMRAPQHQFMDLIGDGQLDCVVLDRPGAGFYQHSTQHGWHPFQPLQSAPNIDWADPNLKMVDVGGDGLTDLLLTAQDSLTYFPSCSRHGFGPPVRLPKPTDEEAGPAIVFADSERSIFLADMSGDGLSDIVRIRNGEICYWPNLGYGKFGAKVNMDLAPWFDRPDRFDPARLRLADIDGSGVIDIVYLGSDSVRIYFNQSGNAWSSCEQIMDYPPTGPLAAIQALDLLGNGTACLVWTSADPADAGRSIRYIDMMGQQKPYLMIRNWNNLGAETRITYTPSTAFYLADREAGRPWATKLPFPVQVVERIETYDWISRNRFVTRYAYHHGYYDGTEREFRGFGMVEQQDTEELGILTQSDSFPAATNIDAASYVPPVLIKTWFHTGAYPSGPRVTRIYDQEYWPEYGATVSPAQSGAMPLPDSPLPADLTGEELREALRALKGSMLRQEVYALDGGPTATIPYGVSDFNYTVIRLQPFGGNRHAVFLTHTRESLNVQLERTLYQNAGQTVCDQRITHSLVLEIDAYGNQTKAAAIAYGRRFADSDPLMTAGDNKLQSTALITYTESSFTNPIPASSPVLNAYRTPMPAEDRSYELTGYTPSGDAARFQTADFVTLSGNTFNWSMTARFRIRIRHPRAGSAGSSARSAHYTVPMTCNPPCRYSACNRWHCHIQATGWH